MPTGRCRASRTSRHAPVCRAAGAHRHEWRNPSVISGELRQSLMENSATARKSLLMEHYAPRVVDTELETAVATAGAVVVRGARAIGKTESARRLAASELRLDAGDARAVLAREQPSTALDGETPRLLDKWQLAPGLWNEVRRAVDARRQPGQFILTGSAKLDEDPLRHSGAGRFRQVQMRTMSFAETGHSTGSVSLDSLFDDEPVPVAESEISLADVVARIVVGGWPGWFDRGEGTARALVQSYAEDVSEYDFPFVGGRRRDPRRFMAFLRATAGLSAQPATFAAITRRMQEQADAPVGSAAVPELHDFASRLYLVEDQPAWSPGLRSRHALLQTPTRHLVDPSLAAALMGAGSERLLVEPETLGYLFESQVVHDLRVYAQAGAARGVFHYRDSKGRDEMDAVVEKDDGRWLAVEVKVGQGSVEAAAQNLLRVTAKVKRPPSATVVIVPVGVAHRRSDGVIVVPLTVLGP